MPKIAIVNDKDEIIGAAEKSEARKQGQIHRIVRVLLHDGRGNVLLQKRHPKAQDSPNCWDFSAAGHVDENESYEVAAKREMEEELGLKNIPLEPLFKFYTDKVKGGVHIRRFNKVFLAQIEPEVVHPNLAELGGVEWFAKSQITEMIHGHPDLFSSGLKEHYFQIAEKLA
jgi:isopentenyl-diphosphate delta-isomerase